MRVWIDNKMCDYLNGLYLRRADYSDIDLLFNWANDPVVRKNSFNTEFISYETHVNWFNRMIENNLVLQFILMKEDLPIGQIRLDINGDEAEIGYSICREYRGKGYGHKLIQLLMKTVKNEYPHIKRLIAKVKPDNVASKRLFETEKYQHVYNCYAFSVDLLD